MTKFLVDVYERRRQMMLAASVYNGKEEDISGERKTSWIKWRIVVGYDE